MRRRKRPRALPVITFALIAAFFILWGTAMVCLANAAAQNYYAMLVNYSKDFPDRILSYGLRADEREHYELLKATPGYADYLMLDTLRQSNVQTLPDISPGNGAVNVMRVGEIPQNTAVIFCDADGNILHKNGNFVYFRYVTEDVWRAGKEEETESGYSWFDLGDPENDDNSYMRFWVQYNGVKSLYSIRALRITGYMNGSEIVPVKMDTCYDSSVYQALDAREPDETGVTEDGSFYVSHTYTLSGLEREGLLEWQNIFDDSAGVDSGGLVTIYGFYPKMSVYEPGDEVVYQDNKYENLMAVLEYFSGLKKPDYFGAASDSYGLTSTIMFNIRFFHDYTGWEYSEENPTPPLEFCMLTAIESRPLDAAISKLRNVYIITFFIALVLVFAVKNLIKRNLIIPIAEVNAGAEGGWTHIALSVNNPPKWRESFELFKHYDGTKDRLSRDKDTIARLERALKYAEEAELSRRQMTSNIAHELKTPLSVIHSYAEGLSERIAETKRDKYLGVIMSETERMNVMVLEMLDLSRLEAGKVTLSREEFSLSEMAVSVFERLELAVGAKELVLTFDLEEDCNVNADAFRIEQVITNFAVNAVKYTHFGGSINVRTAKSRAGVTFAVENESLPLSKESLSKVWETFYSAESSRTSSGTGLGLAISKSIIELHGGSCAVRNTKTGVEFSFTLPL